MTVDTNTITVAVGELWTLDDLAKLWKAPGQSLKARRRWVWRRVREWRVPNDGARCPRFIPAEVLVATQRHVGRAML